MEQLTIGEVAKRAGLRASALRFYESVGLLTPPSRKGGQRRYNADVLNQLAVIQVAQQAGFTVAEIKLLLYGFEAEVTPSARWRTMAEQKLPEVNSLIARATAMKRLLEEGLNCGCLDFHECGTLLSQEMACPDPCPPGAATEETQDRAQDTAAQAGAALDLR
jgi:MerR family redox-sensitive transcriptional activator SoxR